MYYLFPHPVIFGRIIDVAGALLKPLRNSSFIHKRELSFNFEVPHLNFEGDSYFWIVVDDDLTDGSRVKQPIFSKEGDIFLILYDDTPIEEAFIVAFGKTPLLAFELGLDEPVDHCRVVWL